MNRQLTGVWRYGVLVVGVSLMGLGIALTIRADLGVGPWTVFHIGITNLTGLTVGRASQIVGFVLIVIGSTILRQRPGMGTVINTFLLGFMVDLFLGYSFLPDGPAFVWQILYLLIGIVLIGTGTGIYISVRLGAGPRDSIMLGLARLLGWSVGRVRSIMELVVLVTGFLLGGPVGLGTIVGVLVGPIVQFSLEKMSRLWEVLSVVESEHVPAGK